MTSRRLRILCVTSIFPPDIGGPATYLPRMAEALARRGHQVSVITFSETVATDGGRYPFDVIRIPRHACRPWRWWVTVTRLLLLGRRADVLFVHGLALEAVQANLLLRKPLVQKLVGDLIWERATLQGWVTDSFEAFNSRRYGALIEVLKLLRSWWVRRASLVIVPSDYLGRWVMTWGVDGERVVVIRNATERTDGLGAVVAPAPQGTRIVTVARLVPWKGVDDLLRAMEDIPCAGLVVVGDGPERRRLEAVATTLGLRDRVVFAGRQGQAETLAIMAACDIFVLNSTYEGFPHVVLEALSLGRAVVATAVGGTTEIIRHGDNGVLVTPGSRDELVLALRRLVAAPSERARLGERAMASVTGHSFAAMVDATERVLVRSVTRGDA